ncbi:patatin-like phospholipase family protein [Bacillus piscicola]|uniref:patatin-like phospholipase family protein n=1 Tax=Bacillus piscicola TaxID=1632684 RepID=UPI001F08DDFD|nr:patatin-like phospholipase family protein [Bacillus piscicola]
MKLDGVFAGGGVKAFAFIGALQVMEERGWELERTAGTSAGSLIAALIKAGYTAEELYEIMMQLDAEDLLDKNRLTQYAPWFSWVSVYWRLGLYKGVRLENWIHSLLARKKVYTFGDLPRGSLTIIASDLTNGRIVTLPDDLPKYGYNIETFSVARAVKMSCTLPYFFKPVRLKTQKKQASVIVDGGILSNFPMWVYKDRNEKVTKRPVIGFQLSPDLENKEKAVIKNGVQLFHSLFETMRKAHDLRYISQNDAQNVVFIPIDIIKSTQFHLRKEQKESLIKIGRNKTEEFIQNWHF